MKLELKHLAPYLPFGLKIHSKYLGDNEHVTFEMDIKNIDVVISHDSRKPILKPLSHLNEETAGFESWEYFIDKEGGAELSHGDWEWLFENHFDVFGLIEKGLAIDVNTLD